MRVIVLGAGSIGQRHHRNLLALGARAELVPWRSLAPAWPESVLPGADAVVIATATAIREEIIAPCAARSIPVYVEKPLTCRSEDLARLLHLAAPVAARSVAGFMMRYHPAFRLLAGSDLSDIYRFAFEIGHDVTQWRANWCFSRSYAARAEGGGVLLDLCHEIDMAACLFPGLTLDGVASLGHPSFPGVDMASRVALTLPGRASGVVAMDYLAPVPVRRIALRGCARVHDLDLIAGRGEVAGAGARALDLMCERNDMFLALMRDFLALVAGRAPPSGNPHLPRLDSIGESCALIAHAWESRRFVGTIGKEIA